MTGQFPYGGGPGYGAPPQPPQQPYAPPSQPMRQYPTTPVPYPAPSYGQPGGYGYPQPPQQQAPADPPPRDDRSAGEILSGGGGAPALKIGPKHAQMNEYRGGRITKVETRQERRKRRDEVTGTLVDDGPAFFPRTGRPIMGVVLTVDTGVKDPSIDGDDGLRRMFIEGKTKKDAAGKAIRDAGCDPKQHPAVGGEMYVAHTFYGLKSPGDQQATTEWAFMYRPPASAAGAALGGQQVQQPAPPPVPQYPQQPYAPHQGAAAPAPAPTPGPVAPPQQDDRRPPWERQ